MKYSLSMLALACSLVLIPKNAKSIGSLFAIKGDEQRARFAQRKTGSQSSVKQPETIECEKIPTTTETVVLLTSKLKKLKKSAPVKPEAFVLVQKESKQTIQDLIKKFDG